MDPGVIGILVVLALIATAMVLTVKALPRLTGLADDETSRQGAWLFVLWYVAVVLAGALLGAAFDVDIDSDLPRLMSVMAAATLLGVAVVLAVTRGRVAELGLRRRPRRREEPFGPLLALGMWLAFIPVFAVIAVVNSFVLDLLGVPTDLQSYLELFVEDGTARNAPLVWISIVVLIPLCEELAFRGMLYGGLRRLVPPAAAMITSALVFALLHEAVVMLPVAGLGLLLAWAYERTGRLLVPCVIHVLHNGFTLLMVTAVTP
jgi:membrane protease YdiL (CAAX protease family)